MPTTTKTKKAVKESLFVTTPVVKLNGAKRFKSAKFFTTDNPEVKIWDIGQTFTENFGDHEEKNVPAGRLALWTLAKDSTDPPIKKELGKRRAYLSDLAEALRLQPNGEDGALLTDGKVNIFYIKGMEGFAVSVFWGGGYGWDVGAYSVSSPGPWSGGNRVASREPSGS